MSHLEIVGRSSSHFTRVVRIFALELDVPHTFQPVFDITSMDTANYAGNPALKVPTLVDEHGPLFGTDNICRELVRRSGKAPSVVMRGDVRDRVIVNAEELTLHVMSSEVSIVMAKVTGSAVPPKVAESIENSLRWLDDHIDEVSAALPASRALSFVEVALFCALTHLPFRDVREVASFARLAEFSRRFGERGGARATEYKFDQRPA